LFVYKADGGIRVAKDYKSLCILFEERIGEIAADFEFVSPAEIISIMYDLELYQLRAAALYDHADQNMYKKKWSEVRSWLQQEIAPDLSLIDPTEIYNKFKEMSPTV